MFLFPLDRFCCCQYFKLGSWESATSDIKSTRGELWEIKPSICYCYVCNTLLGVVLEGNRKKKKGVPLPKA